MLVRNTCSRIEAAIEVHEAIKSPACEQSSFEVVFIQWFQLRLKIFSDHKHMVVANTELIVNQSVSM